MTRVEEITPKKHIVRGESLVEMMTERPRPRQKPPQNTVACKQCHEGVHGKKGAVEKTNQS